MPSRRFSKIKTSCGACLRGHRTSSCTHRDREQVVIRPKGRPAKLCGVCGGSLKKRVKKQLECTCDGSLSGLTGSDGIDGLTDTGSTSCPSWSSSPNYDPLDVNDPIFYTGDWLPNYCAAPFAADVGLDGWREDNLGFDIPFKQHDQSGSLDCDFLFDDFLMPPTQYPMKSIDSSWWQLMAYPPPQISFQRDPAHLGIWDQHFN